MDKEEIKNQIEELIDDYELLKDIAITMNAKNNIQKYFIEKITDMEFSSVIFLFAIYRV
ncbi:hypothetical protein [Clostridium magnum]|uniref:Uncharacterized protein n=1 Tax=Clostridium magnum DSM 2767 TaxID=1121326 RepID=A0A162SIF6_9CLOT|nr:hypothetical protein [Clostridium magnum]KZL91311.1 hypothetical protein CLMAG_30700 [Clostridium magnum DSM 2767]